MFCKRFNKSSNILYVYHTRNNITHLRASQSSIFEQDRANVPRRLEFSCYHVLMLYDHNERFSSQFSTKITHNQNLFLPIFIHAGFHPSVRQSIFSSHRLDRKDRHCSRPSIFCPTALSSSAKKEIRLKMGL